MSTKPFDRLSLIEQQEYVKKYGIAVEFDVPFPERKGLNGKKKYPFKDMIAPTSSFYVPSENPAVLAISLLGAFKSYCKRRRLNWEAETKQYKKGVRIWRTK